MSPNTPPSPSDEDPTDIEIKLLLEGVFLYRGFDFREYDLDYLKGRIMQCAADEGLETVSELQSRVMHSSGCMERLVQSLSVGVASFFFEPRFFSTFKKDVIELLRPIPAVKVWVAGCICGAETYSLAILLEEEGMNERVGIYSTSTQTVERVHAEEKRGMVPAKAVRGYARNYRSAGGKKRLSDYYSLDDGYAHLRPTLQTNITWAQHNLVTDASFNQFNCIVCRNVLGHFSQPLRERVHRLFYESLTIGGLLGLGRKDDMKFAPYKKYYEPIDDLGQWYRKIG